MIQLFYNAFEMETFENREYRKLNIIISLTLFITFCLTMKEILI